MSRDKRGGLGRVGSFWHSRVISIISISMVLFLLGLVVLLGLVGSGLSSYVREQVTFNVVLTPDADPDEVAQMQRDLRKEPFVREVVLHSKEEALEELTKELGENPEQFLGWNPLSPTFEITLGEAYVASADSLQLVERRLEEYRLTQSLGYRQDLVDKLNDNIRGLTLVMALLSGLLLLISMVLINNTIRLVIYSRRFLIYTMKLVGATSRFIRRPFVWYNIWSGVMAAIVAGGFLTWGWYYVRNHYPLLRSVLTVESGLIVLAVVLVLGVVISWLSATAAVSRYLRMDVNKLYRA